MHTERQYTLYRDGHSFKGVSIYKFFIEDKIIKLDKYGGEARFLKKPFKTFLGYGFRGGAPFDTREDVEAFITHILSTVTSRSELRDTVRMLNTPEDYKPYKGGNQD